VSLNNPFKNTKKDSIGMDKLKWQQYYLHHKISRKKIPMEES
jgi:hypothetical protein